MKIPFRIATETPTEPVISVDGALGAPGLELSHWPGNRTPQDLRHDLSTGVALNFAALPPSEKARHSEGCMALVNNHYDTDGCLAALAVLQPAWALAHQTELLAAAAAGDFFRPTTEASLMLDAAITNLANPGRSDLDLEGLGEADRHQAASLAAFERIPGWIEGAMEDDAPLFTPELAAWRADKGDLDLALHDDLPHLDFSVWTGAFDQPCSRAPGNPFEPGRHALWGCSPADRLLVLSSGAAGTRVRFLLSTASWFDLETRTTHPRPDLVALAEELNSLEGCQASDTICWRHQDTMSPSPELWFGTEQPALFAQYAAGALAPSGSDPLRIKQIITECVRQAWVFAEDEEEDDGNWQI